VLIVVSPSLLPFFFLPPHPYSALTTPKKKQAHAAESLGKDTCSFFFFSFPPLLQKALWDVSSPAVVG